LIKKQLVLGGAKKVILQGEKLLGSYGVATLVEPGLIQYGIETKINKEKIMPKGKGTYGSKVGRPKKKKMGKKKKKK
jgi:hypothetical protein